MAVHSGLITYMPCGPAMARPMAASSGKPKGYFGENAAIFRDDHHAADELKRILRRKRYGVLFQKQPGGDQIPILIYAAVAGVITRQSITKQADHDRQRGID